MPDSIRSNVKPGFQDFVAGDEILVPRSGAQAVFSSLPAAFNDTIICISKRNSTRIPKQTIRQYLKAVTRYLNSNAAYYFLSLAAPSVMNDRPRLRLDDLRGLPICINGPNDPRVRMILNSSENQLDDTIYKLLGVTGAYAKAVEEFRHFRSKFRNANVPSEAIKPIEVREADEYAKMLLSRLSLSPSHLGKIKKQYIRSRELSIGALGINFVGNRTSSKASVTTALAAYEDRSANAFSENLFLWRGEEGEDIVIIKPLDHQYWTLAKAFSDGEVVFAALLDPVQTS